MWERKGCIWCPHILKNLLGILNIKRRQRDFGVVHSSPVHGLSQDLETGCPELAIVKLLGVLFLKGDHNLFR